MRSVKVFNAHPKYRIRRAETLRLAQRVLKGERCSRAELNIVFINDKLMTQMNGTYLDHPYPTDVISFSLADSNSKRIEGEVYVNVDQARRQAREYGVSFTIELKRLVVHGVLHLVGYDDETKQQRNSMTKKEDFYLQA